MGKVRKMKTGTRLLMGFAFVVLAMTIVVAFCLNTSNKTLRDAFEELEGLQGVITPGAITMSDMAELAATKQSIHEAHARGFRYGLLACAFVALLAVGITVAETRSIVEPLKALLKGTEIIGRGDLDYKVGTDAKDEIGQLSRAIDQMTSDLKKTIISTDMHNAAKLQLRAGEEKLEAINERLHNEIAERKRVEEALEVSKGEFSDFVHMASHDLREPLRKISSFGMLLKGSLGGKLEKENQENLSFMIGGAERMTQMIEDLLAYSRINTKATVCEMVDLNEIVEQLEQLELTTLIEETGTIIEIPQSLPKVHADPILTRQLLQNLIINGIKYRREDIQPRILIRAERITEDKVRIELQDNGVGVDKKHHKDIFKMFIRLHSKQENEGVGTGLAVCKKIVDKYGGQIGIESKVGVGSMFWFTLPESKTVEQEQEKLVSSVKA